MSSTISELDIALPQIPNRDFIITNYGAVGDGIFDNTEAIANTINACKKAGGGKVIIPPGVWLTGPIEFINHLNLHIEAGAILLFTKDLNSYPLIVSSFEGEETIRCQSPIDGEFLHDIAITGKGVIDGSGEAWRPVKKCKMTEIQWKKLIESGGVVDDEGEIWWPTKQALKGASVIQDLRNSGSKSFEDYEPIRDFLRPNLVSFRNCQTILIDGPTFQNSPAWCLHPWICEHITIKNITVRNPWYSQNGDGLDIESCQFGLVENCVFDVGDDAICIKSGKDEAGRELGKRCEDIIIRGCQVYSGHGGFVIGSEMSGGVKNITVSDCSFFGTDIGLRFKSKRGRGGIVENISIENIRMANITGEAIVFHMYYEHSGSEESLKEEAVSIETPIFRDIEMKNITCMGCKNAIILKGLPEMPLANIKFEDVTIVSEFGINSSECIGIQFTNVLLGVEKGPLLTLTNNMNVDLINLQSKSYKETYVEVSGEKTKNITCLFGVSTPKNFVQIGEEVNENQINV
ncbi:glycoside hydrolase family 28 protein [Alkalihalobacillus sp. MEB130]|uniref:glycoside hydrolase family 28 protein n=1 Tax=Alkalihalobacillus sp. MEB130 TaxID=2976704 RepID=UPI0028DE2969|nr:glycoside hydrolase family 28 protein [Alkalihalobacillus sp. MEB130]MDT8859796.1 glycoside hydrolase family 28 protein [Alkalihalobacillus sp. MEB130]